MKYPILKFAIPSLAAALLTACTLTTPTPPPAAPNACGADGFQHMIGQSEGSLSELDLPALVRVIHPGDMVTMNYVPTRMNVSINAAGLISSITCG